MTRRQAILPHISRMGKKPIRGSGGTAHNFGPSALCSDEISRPCHLSGWCGLIPDSPAFDVSATWEGTAERHTANRPAGDAHATSAVPV